MNRLDPTLQRDTTARHLTPAVLSDWSSDFFELVIALTRQPVAVVGGLRSTRLGLTVVPSTPQGAVARVSIDVGGQDLQLALTHDALDHLAGLLDARNRNPHGAGETLSLDAVEALLVALFSPVQDVTIGRAAWDTQGGGPVAVTVDDVPLPLVGPTQALSRLHRTLLDQTDRLVSAPHAVASMAAHARLSIAVERMVGTVTLRADDLARLQVGAGVLPDQLWPDGLVVAGQRFVSAETGWTVMETPAQPTTCWLRQGHACRMLDEPRLAAAVGEADSVALVGDTGLMALGRLVTARLQGETRQVFQIDQLGSA